MFNFVITKPERYFILMKRTVLTAVFAFFLVAAEISAQYAAGMPTTFFYDLTPISNSDMAVEYIDGIKTYRSMKSGGQGIVGEPFLDPEFKEGAVFFSDSTKLEDVELRYNVYQDKMEVVFEGDTVGIQPSYRMTGLQLGDKIFINSLMYDEWTREFKYGYLELLINGKAMLLKKYEKSFKYNSFATKYNGGGGDRNFHFIDKEKLFYKKGVESAIQVKKRKKKVLEIFGDHAEKIEEYVKENNLRYRKEEDLAKIFQYYNSEF